MFGQVLTYLNAKAAELESEREELAAFQSLDKERRMFEYVLADHELGKVKESLEELEAARVANTTTLTDLRQLEAKQNEDASEIRDSLATIEAEVLFRTLPVVVVLAVDSAVARLR